MLLVKDLSHLQDSSRYTTEEQQQIELRDDLAGFHTEKARLEFISTLAENKMGVCSGICMGLKTKHDAAPCHRLRDKGGKKKKRKKIVTAFTRNVIHNA